LPAPYDTLHDIFCHLYDNDLVRADRLIAILLMLQRRGRITAAAAARELEVSRRTVMRDLEALGAAGVPIYSIRGRNGGYALWEGFRTQLSGLTAEEVRSLPLWGLPAHARLFGLGEARLRARDKMAMSLPAELGDALDWVDQRFLHDPIRCGEEEQPEAIAVLAQAIERHRVISIGSDSTPHYPLGLIDNAGVWYLVADIQQRRRVLPVAGLTVRLTGRRFRRPDDVDLEAAWRTWCDAQAHRSKS